MRKSITSTTKKAEKLIKQLIDDGTLLDADMNTCIDGTIKEPEKKTIANCIKAKYDAGISNFPKDGTLVVKGG